MKAEFTPAIQTFRPVAITITFDTQDELDAFGALFNVCQVAEGLNEVVKDGRIDDDNIRRSVERAGGDCNRLHQSLVKFIRTNI